jgi:hypothetical protein
MPEITLKADKTLVARQVLIHPLSHNGDLDSEIHKCYGRIKSVGISTRGPLILRSQLANDPNRFELRSSAIFQCEDKPETCPAGFEYEEHVRVGPCIYVRFCGNDADSFHAHEKISLYAFENDIPTKKENYTVFVDRTPDAATIDVFVPIDGGLK